MRNLRGYVLEISTYIEDKMTNTSFLDEIDEGKLKHLTNNLLKSLYAKIRNLPNKLEYDLFMKVSKGVNATNLDICKYVYSEAAKDKNINFNKVISFLTDAKNNIESNETSTTVVGDKDIVKNFHILRTKAAHNYLGFNDLIIKTTKNTIALFESEILHIIFPETIDIFKINDLDLDG